MSPVAFLHYPGGYHKITQTTFFKKNCSVLLTNMEPEKTKIKEL